MSIVNRRLIVATLLVGCLAGIETEADAQYYYQAPRSAYQNDTVGGAVVGGGLGAVTGAIFGGRKRGGENALIHRADGLGQPADAGSPPCCAGS